MSDDYNFDISFENGATFSCESDGEENWRVTGEIHGRVKCDFNFTGCADTLVFQYISRFAKDL